MDWLTEPLESFHIPCSSFEKRIYIPLPDKEARKTMFQLNVGSTPCKLNQQDYMKLAAETDG